MSKDLSGFRVIVTGANRGLGLEFMRQFLGAGDRVFALARHPEASSGLDAAALAHPNRLTVGRVDVDDEALIHAAHEAMPPSWGGVDILINNAGTFGSRAATLDSVDEEEMLRLLDVNALGALRVTRAFIGDLGRGVQPKVVNITSLMGSMQDNTSGGAWAYRVSKAALNMLTVNLGHELRPRGITCVAMHPGWVRTDMGGDSAPLSVHDSVSAMIRTIRGLGLESSGAFLDRDGNRLPW